MSNHRRSLISLKFRPYGSGTEASAQAGYAEHSTATPPLVVLQSASTQMVAQDRLSGGIGVDVVRVPLFQIQLGQIMSTLVRPPGSGVMYHTWRIDGAIDNEALRRAIRAFCNQHEALRTSFEGIADPLALMEDSGRAMQVIHQGALADIEIVSADEALSSESEILKLSAAMGQEIDLEAGPTLVARIIVGHGVSHLLIAVSHAVWDEGSVDIFLQQVPSLYHSALEGTAPSEDAGRESPSYVEFKMAQEERLDSPRCVEYWTKQLAGIHPVAFPVDREWPASPKFLMETHTDYLTSEQTSRFALACELSSISPFALFTSAVADWVAAEATAKDICITIPVSYRRSAETRDIVGLMSTILLLRIFPGNSPEITARRTSKAVLEAIRYSETHYMRFFGDIDAAMRAVAGSEQVGSGSSDPFAGFFDFFVPCARGVRLYADTLLPPNWPQTLATDAAMPGQWRRLQSTDTARHQLPDLTFLLAVSLDGNLRVVTRYSADIFETETMVKRLARLRSAMTATVEATIDAH